MELICISSTRRLTSRIHDKNVKKHLKVQKFESCHSVFCLSLPGRQHKSYDFLTFSMLILYILPKNINHPTYEFNNRKLCLLADFYCTVLCLIRILLSLEENIGLFTPLLSAHSYSQYANQDFICKTGDSFTKYTLL